MKARQETSLFKESAIKQGIGKAQLLADVITQSMGMFRTEQVDKNGGMIIYLHDKANLYESAVVWKISSAGFFVSTDGMRTWNAGITPEGDVAVNVLSAVGINFDWARGGTLTLGGKENGHGVLQVLNENEGNVFRVNNEGIVAGDSTLACKDGVRTTLIFNSRTERDFYNVTYDGIIYSSLGGCVIDDGTTEFSTGGLCGIVAFIPSTFVVENAIIFGSFIADKVYWDNPQGDDGFVTGYSRNIVLEKLTESILIKDVQDEFKRAWEYEKGTIPVNAGDFNGSKSGPATKDVITYLESGNIANDITPGEVNFFRLSSDIYKSTTFTTSEIKKGASYAGKCNATLYVTGYYK